MYTLLIVITFPLRFHVELRAPTCYTELFYCWAIAVSSWGVAGVGEVTQGQSRVLCTVSAWWQTITIPNQRPRACTVPEPTPRLFCNWFSKTKMFSFLCSLWPVSYIWPIATFCFVPVIPVLAAGWGCFEYSVCKQSGQIQWGPSIQT